MMRTIDLNADLGEDSSEAGLARDIALMAVISSCNIACGGHAGDAASMRTMLHAARANGVAAGAHPSYPDRANFGRRSLTIAAEELLPSLRAQVMSLSDMAKDEGCPLTHLKAHGALYNDAQDDTALAGLLAELAEEFALPLVGMPGSALAQAASARGITYIAEGFVDRAYTVQGRLQPRDHEAAMIDDDAGRAQQALAIAAGEPVRSVSGEPVFIQAQTLCLHSDSNGALASARAIRSALEEAGFGIAAP